MSNENNTEQTLPTFIACVALAAAVQEYLYNQTISGKPVNENILTVRKWYTAWTSGDAYEYIYTFTTVASILVAESNQ